MPDRKVYNTSPESWVHGAVDRLLLMSLGSQNFIKWIQWLIFQEVCQFCHIFCYLWTSEAVQGYSLVCIIKEYHKADGNWCVPCCMQFSSVVATQRILWLLLLGLDCLPIHCKAIRGVKCLLRISGTRSTVCAVIVRPSAAVRKLDEKAVREGIMGVH